MLRSEFVGYTLKIHSKNARGCWMVFVYLLRDDICLRQIFCRVCIRAKDVGCSLFCHHRNPLLTYLYGVLASNCVLVIRCPIWRRCYCCRYLILFVTRSCVCRRFQCNILSIVEVLRYCCTCAVI